MKRNILLITGLLALFAFSACTPISKQALSEVNATAPFQEIRADTDRFLGKTVLWGGVIINTSVRKAGSYIKVLETRLDSQHEPQDTGKSGGRFLVYDRGFLDPAVYRHGTRITVIGEVTGKENLPLGQISYLYPVVEARHIYTWKPAQGYYYPYYPPTLQYYGWDWW